MPEQYISDYTGPQIDSGLSDHLSTTIPLTDSYFDSGTVAQVTKYGKVVTINASNANLKSLPNGEYVEIGSLPSQYWPSHTIRTNIVNRPYNNGLHPISVVINGSDASSDAGKILMYNYGPALPDVRGNGGWMVTYVQ